MTASCLVGEYDSVVGRVQKKHLPNDLGVHYESVGDYHNSLFQIALSGKYQELRSKSKVRCIAEPTHTVLSREAYREGQLFLSPYNNSISLMKQEPISNSVVPLGVRFPMARCACVLLHYPKEIITQEGRDASCSSQIAPASFIVPYWPVKPQRDFNKVNMEVNEIDMPTKIGMGCVGDKVVLKAPVYVNTKFFKDGDELFVFERKRTQSLGKIGRADCFGCKQAVSEIGASHRPGQEYISLRGCSVLSQILTTMPTSVANMSVCLRAKAFAFTHR